MLESRPRADRWFFGLAGLWFVALTLVGFSPTFYWRSNPVPLPFHLIIHGVLYSTWILVFLCQTQLIATRRTAWHRRLGAVSVLLLILMIPVGFYVVLVKTAAGLKSIDDAGFNLTELTLSFALAFAGLAMRRRPFLHKRLMLFAVVVLTVAAADRVAGILGLEAVRPFRKVLAAWPGIAVVVYDALSLGRVPILSASLLALVWLVTWFTISDFLFQRPAGEALIHALTRIVVW